jgi:hypothetical protein
MDEAAEMFVFARTESTDTRTLLVCVDWRVLTSAVNSVADSSH